MSKIKKEFLSFGEYIKFVKDVNMDEFELELIYNNWRDTRRTDKKK